MSIMEYKEKNVSNWKNKKGQWFSGKGILVLVWPRWVLSFTKCKVYCFTGLIENMCLLLTTFCHFISPCTGLTCSESVEKFRYGPVEQESRRWEAAGWESAVSRQPLLLLLLLTDWLTPRLLTVFTSGQMGQLVPKKFSLWQTDVICTELSAGL